MRSLNHQSKSRNKKRIFPFAKASMVFISVVFAITWSSHLIVMAIISIFIAVNVELCKLISLIGKIRKTISIINSFRSELQLLIIPNHLHSQIWSLIQQCLNLKSNVLNAILKRLFILSLLMILKEGLLFDCFVLIKEIIDLFVAIFGI